MAAIIAGAVKGIIQSNNVVVGVRIRPPNAKEIEAEMESRFTPSDDALNVQELNEDGNICKNWSYDYVFGSDCSNQYIFQSVGVNLVHAALEGYNSVLFMYGQTSSGKTFTLFGDGPVEGMVGHTLKLLDERMHSSEDTEFLVKMTYSELYNEELKDLLSVQPNENLKIIDDPNLGPIIQNVTEVAFTSAASAKAILDEGEKRRHFGVTNMNAHSSRSHVLVRLNIECRKVSFKPTNPMRSAWGKDKPTSISTLNLVDLAGSERSNKAGTTGTSLKEGSFINKSLLTLGTVIANLSEGKDGAHIPYRNSKLTRLLAGALGGNAKTTMITCISPASGNVAESQSTLRFAQRAKKIVNKVKKNDIMDAKTLASKILSQNDIIDALKQQMQKAKDMGFNEDFHGETVKDKAVATTKALRSLKFLMLVTPNLIRCLKEKHMFAEAECVAHDLKLAFAGKVDLTEIINRGQEIVEEYLPTESKLLGKFMDVKEANDSDIMFDVGELEALSEENAAAYHEKNGDDDADVEDGLAALFSLEGSSTNPEELEGYQMLFEDLRVAMFNKIQTLNNNNDKLTLTMKDFKSKYLETQRANETLKSDLSAATVTHTHYVEDSSKARMDLKKQVEMLRSNMNNMLVKGGETSHILQEEVRELHVKVEEFERDIVQYKESKKRMEQEVAFLRSELGHRLANEAQYMRDITTLQHTVSAKNTEVQATKYELSSVVPKLDQLEKNNSKIRQNLLDLVSEHELTNANKQDQISELKRVCAETMASLELSASQLKAETISGIRNVEIGDHALALLREQMETREQKFEERLHEQNIFIESLQQTLREEKQSATKRIDLLRSQKSQYEAEITTLRETLQSYDELVEKEIKSGEDSNRNSEKLAKQEEERAWNRVRRSVLEGEDLYSVENIRSKSPAGGHCSRNINGVMSSTTDSLTLDFISTLTEVDDTKMIHSVVNSASSPRDGGKSFKENRSSQSQKTIKAQREFLSSPVPLLDEPLTPQSKSKSRLDNSTRSLIEESAKFKTLRLSLSLSNAMIKYTTGNLLSVFQCANTLNRSNQLKITHCIDDLEIALEEKYSLANAKSSLDKSLLVSAQREIVDEEYIGKLEGQITEMRQDISDMALQHTTLEEDYKQALAANTLWGCKFNNLKSEIERIEKDKISAQKDSKKSQEDMANALEHMYMAESRLGLKEQELVVLQAERDELAKVYYKIGSADDDFTYLLAEEESKSSADALVKKGRNRRASILKLNAKESV